MDLKTAIYQATEVEVADCLKQGDLKKALNLYQDLYNLDSIYGEVIAINLEAILKKCNKDMPQELSDRYHLLINQMRHKPPVESKRDDNTLSGIICFLGGLTIFLSVIALFVLWGPDQLNRVIAIAVFFDAIMFGFIVIGFGLMLKYLRQIRDHLVPNAENPTE